MQTVTPVIPRKRPLPTLEQVRRDLSDIIAFYRDQKPSQKRVIITAEAWERIKTSPVALRSGFVIDGDSIRFDGFDLVRHEERV